MTESIDRPKHLHTHVHLCIANIHVDWSMQVIIDYFECEITIYFQEATTCIVIVSLILIFIYDSQVKILLY